MTFRTRTGLVTASLVVAVGLLPVFAPGAARSVGIDYGLPFDLGWRPAPPPPKWSRISYVIAFDQEMMVKEEVAADLAAGRVTLAEATEDFLLMTGRDPSILPAVRLLYPGDTDREKVARSVIRYTRSKTACTPDVADRLDAEFQTLFRPAAPAASPAADTVAGQARPVGPRPPFARSAS